MSTGSSSGAPAHELVTVRLLGLPLPLHAAAREHSEALRREFQLIAQQMEGAGTLASTAREAGTPEAGAPGGRATERIPDRLLELTAILRARYSGFTLEQEDAIDAGIDAGEPSIDLTFTVPAAAGQAALELAAVLDDADEYCRAGTYLLTMATPEPLVAYRRWYLEEFVAQIAGRPPRPWPDAASTRPAAP